MRPKLGKNNQQWIFDYLIKTTGAASHWEYAFGVLPPEIKQWDMIHKVMGKHAARYEEVAKRAEAAEHYFTAWELYYRAVIDYYEAQHSICEDGNPNKMRLYEGLLRCHEKVRKYSPHPIEKVEIPWGGKAAIPGLLHLIPDRRKAPCIIYIPGMDQCKEGFPNARGSLMQVNPFILRGMHAIAIDGPGQGESYMRQNWVRPDNHCETVKAVIDYLLTRPEIDGDKIGIFGMSMGSYWVAHAAAYDNRIKAAAGVMGTFFMDRRPIFEEASPRFRLTYKYMAGIEDDDEFDEVVVNKMTCRDLGSKIKVPFLIQAGEFDPLNPLEEADAFFEEIAGPKEMWVMEDDFHGAYPRGLCNIPLSYIHADWLKDKLEGKYPKDLAKRVLIPTHGMAQYT
ncbi:alpha/beta hydrolase [Chloroflexota bacterium]